MEESSVQISRAEIEDINAIYELESAIGGFPYSRAVIRQHFDLGSVLYIAKDCGKAVAYGLGALNPLDKSAHVIAIMTLPEYRGRGFAKSLCEKIISELKALEPSEIRAVVSPENQPSLALFHSLGFSDSGTEANYYGQDELRVILKL